MEIKQEAIDNAGRFYVEKDSETLAEMDYELPDKTTILITHTEVSDKLAGKGNGRQLVSAAVHYARNKSLVLNPPAHSQRQYLIKRMDLQTFIPLKKIKANA